MKEMNCFDIVHIKPNAQNLEMWIAYEEGQAIGHIFMTIETGNKIKFLDAWVDENHRRRGIFRLWVCV